MSNRKQVLRTIEKKNNKELKTLGMILYLKLLKIVPLMELSAGMLEIVMKEILLLTHWLVMV